ncbi:uncharacterized protein MONOS_9832 [Monocercomonoides exilis]|uniref:uncharacterized protein n=1 Tax=Monocercomonoides exilis TaxID=2049356 RepID=UPI00355A8694|nr:hypothetical protein MONOS_9832 [Monocercomonoides exilis]|eukprot:MONOS_9832.1-p1 / transcript=MONOS_9832.1 / gene=MONOS_9832 / organism=Monocercomonoides_exilis_PA203 / gene_product=unspecified product / transcript_product=unspecified product / location=Mono_scaffold00420:49027-52015(+) / protein_length=977 / sequence_SO=supercontig / SO=protein_coding / is_pseudo=false
MNTENELVTDISYNQSAEKDNEALISREEVCERMLQLMRQILTPERQRPDIREIERNKFRTPQNPLYQNITTPIQQRRANSFSSFVDPIETPTLNRVFPTISFKAVKEDKIKETKKEENESDDSSSESEEESEECEISSESDVSAEEEESDEEGEEELKTEFDKQELDEAMKFARAIDKPSSLVPQSVEFQLDNPSEETKCKNDAHNCKRSKEVNGRDFGLDATENIHMEHTSSVEISSASVSASASASSFASSLASASASVSASESASTFQKGIQSSRKYRAKTRMDFAVEKVGKEKAKKYMEIHTIWSEATKKKFEWVDNLLHAYAKLVEKEPWPLRSNVARGFVLFCGKECQYPLTSIAFVIVPSLKRINLATRKKKLNKKTLQAMRDAMTCLRFNRNVLKKGKGKEPALIWDVQRIVQAIPHHLKSREMEISLFLVAVHTGARAVTLANVLYSDITRIVVSKMTKKLLVTLRYNRAKGRVGWGHEVTIEGSEEEENYQDPVYWLSAYLKSKTNIPLSKWMEEKHTIDQSQRIWEISEDSMSFHFKERSEYAGYPRRLFSFHSLRSGFICTSLIKAGSSTDAQNAIMEKTALIAGWVPWRLAQMGYLKMVAKRTIVSSRLVSSSSSSENVPLVDETLLDVEAFHGISLEPPKPKEKEIDVYAKFRSAVDERIRKFFGKTEIENAEKYRYNINAYRKIFESNEDLKELVEMKEKEMKKKSASYRDRSCKNEAEKSIGLVYVKDMLYNHNVDPLDFANTFCKHAENGLTGKPTMKYKRKKRIEDIEEIGKQQDLLKEKEDGKTPDEYLKDRERNERMNLKRRYYTEEEDKILIEMFQKGESYIAMAKRVGNRSPMHIMYHLKVLMKKGIITKKHHLSIKELLEMKCPKKQIETHLKENRKKISSEMNKMENTIRKSNKRKRNYEEEEEEEEDFDSNEENIECYICCKRNKRLKRKTDGFGWEEDNTTPVVELELQ